MHLFSPMRTEHHNERPVIAGLYSACNGRGRYEFSAIYINREERITYEICPDCTGVGVAARYLDAFEQAQEQERM